MEYRFTRVQVFTLVACAFATGLNGAVAAIMFAKGRDLAGTLSCVTVVAMMLVVASLLRGGRGKPEAAPR